MKRDQKLRIFLEITIALIFFLSAISLGLYSKSLITKFVLQAVELKPDTKGYTTWLNPPTTITRDYYLFNVSNPLQIVTHPSSATVEVKETPPYSYLISATKKDVSWSTDKKSLSYSIYRMFTRHETRFNPSAVNHTGTFVDLLRATFRTQFGAKAAQSFYDIAGLNTFYERNAVEQLEGFTSELHSIMKDKMYGPNIEKSGFIYRYNGSRSYSYTIKSGLEEKGQVLAFTSETVPFSFSSPDFYDFTIYDGLTFIPMLFDKPSMNIFQADFCRPINAKFNRVLSMFGGIDVHEYIIRLVDFSKCTNTSDINTCPEVSKLDVSKCISASLPENTVFLSKPHFYGSSNETIEEMNIEGFTPTHDKHEALIYFDPYSGTPLRAHHRIQLNIEAIIDPMRESSYGSDLEPTNRKGIRRVLPLVWIDQEVNVDSATLSAVRMVHFIIRYGLWICIVVAVFVIAIAILMVELIAAKIKNNKQKTSSNLPEGEEFLSKQRST